MMGCAVPPDSKLLTISLASLNINSIYMCSHIVASLYINFVYADLWKIAVVRYGMDWVWSCRWLFFIADASTSSLKIAHFLWKMWYQLRKIYDVHMWCLSQLHFKAMCSGLANDQYLGNYKKVIHVVIAFGSIRFIGICLIDFANSQVIQNYAKPTAIFPHIVQSDNVL